MNPTAENILYALDKARNDETNRDFYINKARISARALGEYTTALEKSLATVSAELVSRTPEKP